MQKSENKRIDWIDTLRGLVMFFVVWGHTFPTKRNRIGKYIYSFHMPIFFFISGLTFRDSDKLPFKDFLKKRFKGLIVPYLCINAFCYLIDLVLSYFNLLAPTDALKNFLGIFVSNGKILPNPWTYSWFLLTLFSIEIIFYLLKKKIKGDGKIGVIVAIMGIIGYLYSKASFFTDLPFHFDTIFIAIVFYYLGYLLMKNIKVFDKIFESKIIMFILGGALGLVGLITQHYNARISMYNSLYGKAPLFFISSIATTLALILFVNIFMNKSKFFNTIGKNTLFYYGYHGIIIKSLKYTSIGLFSSNKKILLIAALITFAFYPISLFIKEHVPIMIGKIK